MTVTFRYDCERCGAHDELPPAGGRLSCTCDKALNSGEISRYELGTALKVTKVVDGEAEWHKTVAEIEGLTA